MKFSIVALSVVCFLIVGVVGACGPARDMESGGVAGREKDGGEMDGGEMDDAMGDTAPAHVAGELPKVGDAAPEFTLVSNEGTEVTLSDQRGKWVALYFYPKDFTSGCTIQARRFQEDMATYEEKNAIILGVSVDDAESHAEFCEKEGLRFKLLADVGGDVSDLYGSVRGEGDARRSARNTFLISPDGKIAAVFTGVDPDTNSDEVLDAIERLDA